MDEIEALKAAAKALLAEHEAEHGTEDASRAELSVVAAQASAAARRSRDALTAIHAMGDAPEDSADRMTQSLVAGGDATSAALSLYIAAAAALRYSEKQGEAGPLGLKRLGKIVEATEALRDAVMHWDDKLKRDSGTFLGFSDEGLVVYAPGKRGDKGPSKVAAIMWAEVEDASVRLYRWAIAELDLPGWRDGDLDGALPTDPAP